MKKYYPFIRKLHLYFGLFISPFVLIFSFSMLAINHEGWLNRFSPVTRLPELRTKLDKILYDSSDLATAKAICRKLGIEGEVDFISKGEDYISFPVNKPGLKTWIKINTLTDSALITHEQQGSMRAMSYLHKMPGPHNEKIRGNTIFMAVWRVMADLVVYVLLFLSVSGIFLWYFLKIERNLGLFGLTLGVVFFTTLFLLIF
ncbi:MAG: PepSY-associated TM helix domain-containing protein [Ferruginibacter sp.]